MQSISKRITCNQKTFHNDSIVTEATKIKCETKETFKKGMMF
jgi:hypothetical protein